MTGGVLGVGSIEGGSTPQPGGARYVNIGFGAGVGGASLGFTLLVTLFLIAGYLLIDAMMGIQSPALSNTPFLQRAAETPLKGGKFLTLAVLIGLLCAAAVLGLGYLLSP
jgi:hypothetical protein